MSPLIPLMKEGGDSSSLNMMLFLFVSKFYMLYEIAAFHCRFQ